MSKKRNALLRLFSVSLVIGLSLTVLLGVFVTSSKTYVDLENSDRNICASLDCVSTESTDRGFPMSIVTTFENGSADLAADWRPINLAANVAFFSAVAFGVLYLRRKIQSSHG